MKTKFTSSLKIKGKFIDVVFFSLLTIFCIAILTILFTLVRIPQKTKASANTLTIKIKTQGIRRENDNIKVSVDFYSGSEKVFGEPNISFTYTNGIFIGNVPLPTDFKYDHPYALFIKPVGYVGKLFCNQTVIGDACKTPAFFFLASGSLVELTSNLLLSGDLSPPDGKVDAQDLSLIMKDLGKISPKDAPLNTDLNNDGIVDVVDYSLALYSLSKNAKDDVVALNAPVSTPTIEMIKSATPTSPNTTTPTLTPMPTITPPQYQTDSPITRKVMVIDFNPILKNKNNQRLRQNQGWSEPKDLEQTYINDVKQVSGGVLNYQIVSRVDNVDEFPIKSDGFTYTEDQYLDVISGKTPHHNPDIIDYNRVLSEFNVCDKLNRGEIDELWLWAGPWMGFWEAVMTGPGAYNTNAPPFSGNNCNKKLVIMGFVYEVGVDNMLEDLGHRMEGTLSNVFGEANAKGESVKTDWGQFTKIDKYYPGNANCGFVHYAPNSQSDYDWSNQNVVASRCDEWLTYPNLSTEIKQINCQEWGCAGYGYKKWWLSHFPHVQGQTNGKWNNWWRYAADN